MKKHNILIALAMVIVVMFTACTGDNPQEPGQLRVILDSWQNTRSLESNVLLDTARYGITAIYQGTENVEALSTAIDADATAKEVLFSLFPGNWKVQVDAFNAYGQQIGTGMSDVVSIVSGGTTSCKVRVEECSGMGTLNVRLAGIYEEYEVKATIEREIGDPDPIIFNLDKAAGTYYGSMNLEHGSYLFNIFLNGNKIWTEAVRVVAHGQTNADVLVSNGNKIELSTKPNVNVNRITSDSLVEGGTVNNHTLYTFHSTEPSFWYVNGSLKQDWKSCDFRWSPDGIVAGESCTVGALSGHDTYDTFTAMHFTAAGADSRIVTASIEDTTYMVGGSVVVRFDGLPAEQLILDISMAGNTDEYRLSPNENGVFYRISPEITAAGEYEMTFNVRDHAEIVIPSIKIKLGLPNLNPSYDVHILPNAYLGDYIRVQMDQLPFDIVAKGYVNGVETCSFITRLSQNVIRFPMDESISGFGGYDFELKLFNAGRELKLNGNKGRIEVKEYTVPEGISISFNDPVYNGGWRMLNVSPALEVDMEIAYACDGIEIEANGWIDAGYDNFYIFVPDTILPGSHEFTFKGYLNGKWYDLPAATVDIKVPKAEVVAEMPKYVSDYYSYVDIICKDPDFLSYDGMIKWYLDGEFIWDDYKSAGDDLAYVDIGNILQNGSEYELSGICVENNMKIKPMRFIASQSELSLDIKSVYESGKMSYSITPDVYLENGETCDSLTLQIQDEAELDKLLTVADGIECSWVYEGKKPYLYFMGEVRNAEGVLLLRERIRRSNFQAEIVGADYVYLSDAESESNQSYSVKFNRNDIDWGPDFNGIFWKLDGKPQPLSDEFNCIWDKSMKGKHRLACWVDLGRYMSSLVSMEVIVTEEVLDPAMDFNIVNIHRLNSKQIGYEFEFESDIPVDRDLLSVTAFVDGEDLSRFGHVYLSRNSSNKVLGYAWLPENLPLGNILTINVVRLDTNGNIVARSSVDYAMHDIYLKTFGYYRQKVSAIRSFTVEGIGPNEDYSIFVDGKELDKINDLHSNNGNDFMISLMKFGCGPHDIQVKVGSEVSEVISWYAEPGIDMKAEDQELNPDASRTITLKLYTDPADNLPSEVTYSFWYQYPGEAKVTLDSNTTGIFELPTDKPDQTNVTLGYEATCGGRTFSDVRRNLRLYNCQITGLPETIERGSTPKTFDVAFKWYNDLIDYSKYDFIWEINDMENVASGQNVSLTIPTDVDVSVWCNMVNKTDPDDSRWLHWDIEMVDGPVI